MNRAGLATSGLALALLAGCAAPPPAMAPAPPAMLGDRYYFLNPSGQDLTLRFRPRGGAWQTMTALRRRTLVLECVACGGEMEVELSTSGRAQSYVVKPVQQHTLDWDGGRGVWVLTSI